MTTSRQARPAPISITQLINRIKVLIQPSFTSVWVTGEISSLMRANSGHLYFNVKDSQSAIKAVIWQSTMQRVKFELKNGMAVVGRGSLDLYSPNGDLKLIIDHVEPVGIGAEELALRQLKERLHQKGYFAKERKRALPRFPKRLGIITSLTGAAVRDLVELFTQRWPMAEYIVRHAKVQGDGAAYEIAASINHFNQLHTSGTLTLDALVVGRGGGSRDDLAAFNEEIVANAIFRSQIPIVSAVGHEIDLTIADFVADDHAETPSAAVIKMTPDGRELQRGLLALTERMQALVVNEIAQRKVQLDRIIDRPVFRRPTDQIEKLRSRLIDQFARLKRHAQNNSENQKKKLIAMTAQLESLSPLNILTRGYSLTLKNQKIVTNSDDVQIGDEIETKLANGSIRSVVK
jgi:exodeoxyribonuclease VII large subunit